MSSKGFKDPARAMLIYEARKRDGRTFVDIARELGISDVRVRQIFRKLDWQLNRYNAEHHQPGYVRRLKLDSTVA